MNKNGLGQKFKMPGLEIEIPLSPREDGGVSSREMMSHNAEAPTLSSSRKSMSQFSQ